MTPSQKNYNPYSAIYSGDQRKQWQITAQNRGSKTFLFNFNFLSIKIFRENANEEQNANKIAKKRLITKEKNKKGSNKFPKWASNFEIVMYWL